MELLSICTGVLNWAFAFQDLYILFSYHYKNKEAS